MGITKIQIQVDKILVSAMAFIVLALLSLIPVGVVAQQGQQGYKVEAVTYDYWLKGRECKVYGGTLKVAFPEEPNEFVWLRAGSDWSLNALMPIYDRLVRLINGTLTFEVAESMEYTPDYKILTIKIRDGIKWHDGKPLTAEDVAFTINALATQKWTYYHSYFVSVDHAEAVDARTVRVYFKEPDAGFIYNGLANMNIMPKHVWEPLLKEKGEGLVTYMPKIPDEMVGSGPFKMVEYVPGQYIKYKANENYWLGRPCIDELVVVFIKETSVALLAVQRGDIDVFIGFVTGEVVPQLLATEGVGIHVYTSDYFYHWGFNNLRWPFNITEFRRALAFAVDRKAIVEEILMGYGLVGSPGVVPPVGVHLQWYNPNVADAITFNLSKSAEILDKLGFKDVDGDGWREAPDGSKFSFEIYPPSYDIVRVRAAQKIAEWLSQIPGGGIKAVVRVLDWKTVWPMIREGKVDTYLLGSGPGNDISWLYIRFHSWPQGSANWARYSNPEVDALTEKLKVTFDPNERKEIAWKIQEILAHDVPILTLYYRKYINPYRADKFTMWFRPSDTDIYNWLTLLRVQRTTGTPQQESPPPTQAATTPLTPETTRTTPGETAVAADLATTTANKIITYTIMGIIMILILGLLNILMRKRK